MKEIDRRKYPRVKIHHCISYVCLNSKNDPLDPKMGFVRNVSQEGACIETVCPIKSKYVLLIFIDVENNHTEIKGKFVYCKKIDSGKFETGIRFEGVEFEKLIFITKLVRSYHYQKRNSRSANSEGTYGNLI